MNTADKLKARMRARTVIAALEVQAIQAMADSRYGDAKERRAEADAIKLLLELIP